MAASTPKPIHIAIVGGGIGGLAFAIGLRKFPHLRFTIYEATGAFSEIGAGIGFGANSHLAMSLIDPAVWEGYKKVATFNGWEAKSNVWFDFQYGEKGPLEGKRIAEIRMESDMTQSTAARSQFLDELVKLVPEGSAVFKKRLTGIVHGEDGKSTMIFADGTEAQADVIVGCDGIKSACRAAVYGAENSVTAPVFTKKVAYRALVPIAQAIEVLGEERAMNRQMYLGHGGHFITFPVGKFKMLNVVAFHTSQSDTWEGPWIQPEQKDNLDEDFGESWGTSVWKIKTLISKPDVWAIFGHLKAPTYFKSNIILLGDAAHAVSPHFGAGAGMALEDAFILSNLLGKCTSMDDLPSAFKAYDFVRVPRTQKVIDLSHRQGAILDLECEGVGDDLELLAEDLQKTVRYIWDLDLVTHCKEALDRFDEEDAQRKA